MSLASSNPKSEPCVFETCLSKLRRKTPVHFPTAEVRAELGSPHPQRLEAGPFDLPLTDLRDYLTKKWSVHLITSQCCCERLITAVLSECHYNSHATEQSVFNRLSNKRHRFHRKRTFSDTEYPEVTANMVGPSTTPNRTKEKQPIVSSDESDIDLEGVY